MRNWLPDMDLNHDKQIQSLLCYRYTIGQGNIVKLEHLNSRVKELRIADFGWRIFRECDLRSRAIANPQSAIRNPQLNLPCPKNTASF